MVQSDDVPGEAQCDHLMSLGQVAFETRYGQSAFWDQQTEAARRVWDRLAQAVREAVIEECAKLCESKFQGSPNHLVARGFAEEIRALKSAPPSGDRKSSPPDEGTA